MAQFIQELPQDVFLCILGFIFIFALAPFALIWRMQRTARLIRSTPRAKVGGSPNGLVALQGRAEGIGGATLKTPLTDTVCLWYRASVDRYERQRTSDPNSSFRWRTERTRTSSIPFLLSDGSGVCLVHPTSSEITPHDESLWYGNSPVPTDRTPPKLEPHTSGFQPHYADNVTQQFRYKEERIYSGNELFIIGEMGDVPPPEPSEATEDEPEDIAETRFDSDDTSNLSSGDEEDTARTSEDEAFDKLDALFDLFEEEDEEKALAEGRKRTDRMLSKVRLLSARPPEEILKMMTIGSNALLLFGAAGLLIAGWFLWTRFRG